MNVLHRYSPSSAASTGESPLSRRGSNRSRRQYSIMMRVTSAGGTSSASFYVYTALSLHEKTLFLLFARPHYQTFSNVYTLYSVSVLGKILRYIQCLESCILERERERKGNTLDKSLHQHRLQASSRIRCVLYELERLEKKRENKK